MSGWSERVVAVRWPVLVLAAIVTVALAIPASRLETDNSLRQWLPAGDERLERYDRFLKTFGSDEYLVVTLAGRDWASPAGIAAIRALAAKMPARAAVQSLADAQRALGGPERLREFIAGNPRLFRPLLSKDGTLTALKVTPAKFDGPQDRRDFVRSVRDVLTKEEGLEWRVGGPPVINVELDELSRREPARYYPFVILVMVAVLVWRVRSVAAALCCLAAPALATVWTLGVLHLCGNAFNMVLVAVPPLLLLLGISYSLHVTSRFLHGGADTAPARASGAARAVGPACLLAALTTAAGFLSLTVSPVRPVRLLGLFSAAGILFSLVLALTVLPALLSFVSARPRGAAPGGRLVRLGAFAGRRRAAILLIGALAAGFAGVGIARIRAESHILRFLREDHRMRRDYDFIENNLVGLTPLDIVIEGEEGAMASAGMLKKIADLQRYLETNGDWKTDEGKKCVDSSLSAADLVDASKSLGYSGLGLAGLRFFPPDVTAPFVHTAEGRTQYHLAASLRTTGSATYTRIKDDVTAYLEREFPPGSARVDGVIPLLSQMQEVILASQAESLGVALAVISVLMVLVLRSVRLAAIALVPNLLPVVITLGVMGWTGILLDTATLTIASVAIGVAVDDTIHFLVAYRRARAGGQTVEDATGTVMATVGRPLVTTTLVAVCGFMLLGLSQFPPLAYFGLLLALTLALAVAADLTVLPSLLAVADRRNLRGGGHAR